MPGWHFCPADEADQLLKTASGKTSGVPAHVDCCCPMYRSVYLWSVCLPFGRPQWTATDFTAICEFPLFYHLLFFFFPPSLVLKVVKIAGRRKICPVIITCFLPEKTIARNSYSVQNDREIGGSDRPKQFGCLYLSFKLIIFFANLNSIKRLSWKWDTPNNMERS